MKISRDALPIYYLTFALVLVPLIGYTDDRPVNPAFTMNTVELFSYQASQFRYAIIELNETPPPGFEQPDFADADFRTGVASFGGGSRGLGDANCPLRTQVQTRWRPFSQLLVRRSVQIPATAANVRLMIAADNDIVAVYVNGVSIAENVTHGNCPILDEFRFDIPATLLRVGEENLIAYHLRDSGRESFFDTRMLAELPTRTLAEVVRELSVQTAEQLPSVSVSALTLECEPPDGTDAVTARARFKVDPTQQRGQVTVTMQRAGRAVSTDSSIAQEDVFHTSQTPQRTLVSVNPEVPRRGRADVNNLAAIPTVLQQPRIVAGLVECLAAGDHVVRPVTECRDNVDVAEQSCFAACAQQNSAANTMCASNDSLCALIRALYRKEADACTRECSRAAATLRRSCPP